MLELSTINYQLLIINLNNYLSFKIKCDSLRCNFAKFFDRNNPPDKEKFDNAFCVYTLIFLNQSDLG